MLIQTLHHSRATRWFAALPLAAATCVAQAQEAAWCTATLVYVPTPIPTSVPSLTTWTVLLLASVLGLVAIRRMRMDTSAKHWAVVLGLALMLAAGSGGMVVNQAIAATANLSNPAGGSVSVAMGEDGGFTPATFTNTTTVTMTITSVTMTSAPVGEGSTCNVGQQLLPGASCSMGSTACTEP